jgi:hypothetical protein
VFRVVVTGVLAALVRAGCVQLTAVGSSAPQGRVVIAAGGTTGV